MNMTQAELNEKLQKHEMWISDRTGERLVLSKINLRGANLKGANLQKAKLYGANLQGADLRYADLRDADLRNADLKGAYLSGADLIRADLRNADLKGADLKHAYLKGAYLSGANLRDADLRNADLIRADLSGADLRNAALFIPLICPTEGSFIAWKKCGEYIVKLLIPEDALRSSATGRKCRASKAKCLEIETLEGYPVDIKEIASDYDPSFVYCIDETKEVNNFDKNRFNECAPGIHFFIDREEAVRY